MSYFKYIIILLLATANLAVLNAQETKVVQDLQLWTGVEVEKSIFSSLTISLKEELRLEKDISQTDNLLTQAGAEYEINKNFSVGGKYRYIRNRSSKGHYDNRSRLMIDLKYKAEIKDFSFQYRLRQQREVKSMKIFNGEEASEKHIRHRITLKYNNLKKIRPSISAELFQLYELHESFYSDNVRVLGGMRYKIQDYGQIKLQYGIEREINTLVPATFFMLKMNYTYKF
jgi:hypothetical protein